MLTNWNQINKKYNIILNAGRDGELTEIEKKIYNGNFSEDNVDMNDCNVLISISNYYILTKNNSKRLEILNKLCDLGDHRGHANLGAYYFNINRNLALSHLEKASDLGNLNAKYNLVKHYIEIMNINKAQTLCEELISLNFVPAYLELAQVYGWKGDITKMMESLEKGIENENEHCMTSLEYALNNDLVQIKRHLVKLKENNLIKNKLVQIENVMNGNGFIFNVNRT